MEHRASGRRGCRLLRAPPRTEGLAFARHCLFQPTTRGRPCSASRQSLGAYPQASSLVAGGDGPNKKTDLRFLLYSTIPGSVNECYGNRHFFLNRTSCFTELSGQKTARLSNPPGGTSPFQCTEGARAPFSRGPCNIFSGPIIRGYPLFFSVPQEE